jgi:alpha-tubulin suppressor-like RCC1 family protein
MKLLGTCQYAFSKIRQFSILPIRLIIWIKNPINSSQERYAGNNHTVGLKSDGTVVPVGLNQYCECDARNWRNIVAISANDFYTVSLKLDSRVVVIGANMFGRRDSRLEV